MIKKYILGTRNLWLDNTFNKLLGKSVKKCSTDASNSQSGSIFTGLVLLLSRGICFNEINSTWLPAPLTSPFRDALSQSSEKATAWPVFSLVLYSSWMSPKTQTAFSTVLN